jgi:eukaryotic-like serine/threonine-protein kinase
MASDPNETAKPRPIATRVFSLDDANQEHNLRPSVPPGDDEHDFEVSGSGINIVSKPLPTPILGEYQIEELIGAGGMGQVFRARHRTMDRHVAIKILPRSVSDDDHAVQRFYTEVRATARLMHPNIVTAFDAGCHRAGEKPIHYLVMELIEGELLSQRISQSGPMNAVEVVEILRQTASALEYAHSQGIVHRDIKPSNMMITPQGVLKILDFGLAVLRGHLDIKAAKETHLVGTVEFMSPEQINAPDTVDHRSDLYSLGATVFYLLTGRPMFHGEMVQTALAQVNTKPQALYEVRSDVDIRLDSIFQSLVAKSPAARCQSASELMEKMISMNLIERPAVQPRVRGSENRLPKLAVAHPTSVGLGRSTSQKAFTAVGIELGMIQSRVSYIDAEHKVEEVLVDGESTELRNMLFSDGEKIAIGARAVENRSIKPNQIFYGMQRWYGLPLLERPFGGRQVPPEVLVACVIRQLATAARHKLPDVSHAVVTVPACYDQMHRLSTKSACTIAGVEVLQLLDKPLAATLAHIEMDARLAQTAGSATQYNKNFLVAMLNGTACEVSVVSVEGLAVRMLSSVGDWKRGTTRWHDRATKRLASEVEAKLGSNARDDLNIASRLQRTMEKSFDRLRHSATVPFVFETQAGKIEGQLDRENLAEWVGDLETDCQTFAQEAIVRSKIDPKAIHSILLIGDVRWMPSIQRKLSQIVGSHAKLTMLKSNDMARGAAIQARNIMPPTDLLSPTAHAVSTYDLGVIIQEDITRISQPKVLIGKDSATPAFSTRTLRFTREGKEQPQLQFVEGSRLGATTWSRLGMIDLKNCFPGRLGSDPLQLRVEIDASGIWSGSLTWLAGNKQIPISPLTEPLMDIVSTKRWRDWLESLMLCNA